MIIMQEMAIKLYRWLVVHGSGRVLLRVLGIPIVRMWRDPSPWTSLWEMAAEHPDDWIVDPYTGALTRR